MNKYQQYHIARKTGKDPALKVALPKPTAWRLFETREGKLLGEGAWPLIMHIKKNHKAANPTATYRTEPIY